MLDVSWIAGYARTSFTHHESPITLATKSGSKTSFSDIVKETTPPCRLNPRLFNGHLQTMYTAVKDPGPPVHYKRHVFESTFSVYPGQFAVDFAIPPPANPSADSSLPERTNYYSEKEFSEIGSSDDKPMLVCLHGLSGGSYEVYLRQVVAPVVAAGWECCVVNGRGCAMSKITTPHLFNARATWDVRQTVHWLRKTFPNRPLYGIGFSLGANIITNYIAEEGESCEFKAAIVCSNPWNLEISHQDLKRSWLGDNVYSKVMGQNLKKLFELHKDQILKNPDIDYDKVKASTRLYEFDRAVQAPTWGYPTEGAYYRDASSVDAVTAIRIPFIGISAEDDPISSIDSIPFGEFQQNPYTVLVTTNWGGHLSWFQTGGKRWFATAAAALLTKLYNDIDLTTVPKMDVAVKCARASNGKYPVWDPMNRRQTVPIHD